MPAEFEACFVEVGEDEDSAGKIAAVMVEIPFGGNADANVVKGDEVEVGRQIAWDFREHERIVRVRRKGVEI